MIVFGIAGLILGAWRKYEILPEGVEKQEVSYQESAEAL